MLCIVNKSTHVKFFSKTCPFIVVSLERDLWISTLETMNEIVRIKQFSRYKNDDIFHIIDEIKFKGYRCESDLNFFTGKELSLCHKLMCSHPYIFAT